MTNDHEIRQVWLGPARERFTRLFETDLLRDDPVLCRDFLTRLDRLVAAGEGDRAVCRDLRAFYLQEQGRFEACLGAHRDERAQARVSKVKAVLPSGFRPSSILDVGCGGGAITAGLSKIFNLGAESVYGLDIYKPDGDELPFQFLNYDENGKIPSEEGRFDLIVTLMVLHHADDPQALLAELSRVLSANGRLLIRETDANYPDAYAFNSAMDKIYYMVFDDKDDLAEDLGFQDAASWQRDFEEAGFQLEAIDRSEAAGPFSPNWFILKKKRAPQPA